MFEYIIDRVKKRTATWSAKFISPAGKEILIKSVALAMPVYAISCFKLPQGIISEIESLLMNFWWEKNSKQRGIPWIAWKKLQYSKKEGGLGFRDLAKFNDALLAKQAWRIIQHPHSLFAKIMKAHISAMNHSLMQKLVSINPMVGPLSYLVLLYSRKGQNIL